ncbi:MAG TPA: NAD-dependent dihydropyrimidine dehydrogenase subunit PreA [Prolixibacteraceae bacterium]|nr:NAD-dependent dihydropyrimidine dehydrogenase subunit PreA [Prolixibacteraceae bacterium]
MADLSINFAGIQSPNPFWLASGPVANTAPQVMRAFEQGWGGAVWKTIGEPVSNVSGRYASLDLGRTRMAGLSNIELSSDREIAANFRDIETVKKHFPNHAVIASLMVQSREEWHQLVKDSQNAGADGIELNFGCPHGMCERGMGSAVGQEPKLVELITRWVMEVAKVPVIVKLTPNITDITEPARAARRGGANAISLINTIKSIAGVDIDQFVSYPRVGSRSTHGGFSGSAVKPIALNMVKSCAIDDEFDLPISGLGGIGSWRDAVEFLLLGAGCVQVCTAVMHHGYGIITKMVDGLETYMDEKGFLSVDKMVGKALPNIGRWDELDLEYKLVARIDPEKCTHCHNCLVSCNDGAYQAISLSVDDKIPQIDSEKCVGCNLCSLVCPIEGCVSMVEQ